MSKIEFNVPMRDPKTKKAWTETRTGDLFQVKIGPETVDVVLQDGGALVHYASGNVISINGVATKRALRFASNPYADVPKTRELVEAVIWDLVVRYGADKLLGTMNAAPLINVKAPKSRRKRTAAAAA